MDNEELTHERFLALTEDNIRDPNTEFVTLWHYMRAHYYPDRDLSHLPDEEVDTIVEIIGWITDHRDNNPEILNQFNLSDRETLENFTENFENRSNNEESQSESDSNSDEESIPDYSYENRIESTDAETNTDDEDTHDGESNEEPNTENVEIENVENFLNRSGSNSPASGNVYLSGSESTLSRTSSRNSSRYSTPPQSPSR